MMQFVKAFDHDSDCFMYISTAFPGLSKEKKKGGIFDRPQIRKLMKDPQLISFGKHPEMFARIPRK